MKKILEKLLFITFAAVILFLGWLIIHYVSGKNNSQDPTAENRNQEAVESESGSDAPEISDNTGSSLAQSEEPGLSEEDLLWEELLRTDIGNFINNDYTQVLLSMFSTEDFNMETFYYYTAEACVKNEHPIQDLDDLADMLSYIQGSPDTVYMILAPDIIYKAHSCNPELTAAAYNEKLIPYIQSRPVTSFFITLPFYSLSYLQSLSADEQNKLLESYYDFYNLMHQEPNVEVFFWGALDWLIANPANYSSESTCVPFTSESLSCFWYDKLYVLNNGNYDEEFQKLSSLMKGQSTDELLAGYNPVNGLCDNSLQNLDIIFFGDSVVGNFKGPSSIPGVVEGLSGAHTYNMAVGGTYATAFSSWSLGDVVDAFLNKDTGSVTGTNAEIGLQKYLDEHQKIVFRKPCFIINYGLNDYFYGLPIEYPDSSPDNVSTYKGGLYSAVKKLKEAYPVSIIIINTPNFCKAFENGTQILGDEGEVLEAYAIAAIETAQALNVEYLDHYTALGLNADNCIPYLRDHVHPNELGRYLIGKNIIKKLTQ